MSMRLMKRCCVVVIVAVGWGGCGQPKETVTEVATDVAENVLPEFVVGTWQPNDSRWILTLEADGTISRMRHFIGVDFVVAEGGVVEPWRDGAEAMYILGSCGAQYDRATGELTVEVNIEEYIITFPNGTMEGSFHDSLSGPVKPERKVWEATWTSTAEMGGSSDGRVRPATEELIFSKVSADVYEN